MYHFDFGVLFQAKKLVVQGIATTLFISLTGIIVSFSLGVILAFLRDSFENPIKSLSISFIELTRNIPLLIHLYIVYKALPYLNITLPPLLCGIIALSIYTSAYIAEVLRAGIKSVAREQKQAATALGLNRFQVFFLIIFPQAIRLVIPALASQFINLLKNSSIVSFIAVADLFYITYKGAVDDFRVYEFFTLAVLVYSLLNAAIALLANYCEKRFKTFGREAQA